MQSRPFGVALLVAGWQEGSGPVLYHTDPSGMFVEHDAKAIGSGSEGAQTTLQVTLDLGCKCRFTFHAPEYDAEKATFHAADQRGHVLP